MTDNRYNGWTNYATWRVNLELFDGMSPQDIAGSSRVDVYDLADMLKNNVEEILEQSGSGLVLDYAMAFLSDVNWHEIAKHMLESYADETETEDEEG